MSISEERASLVRGVANSVDICRLAKKGEAFEDAVFRVGEDENFTMEEIREVLAAKKVMRKAA